jgi:hypothetical protein
MKAAERSKIVDQSIVAYGRQVEAVGPQACAFDIAAAIGAIDASRTARSIGDRGSAESALDKARRLLVGLIIPS